MINEIKLSFLAKTEYTGFKGCHELLQQQTVNNASKLQKVVWTKS